jgi:hypothetical protein
MRDVSAGDSFDRQRRLFDVAGPKPYAPPLKVDALGMLHQIKN